MEKGTVSKNSEKYNEKPENPNEPVVYEEIFSHSGKQTADDGDLEFGNGAEDIMSDTKKTKKKKKSKKSKGVNTFRIAVVTLFAVILLVAAVPVYSALTSNESPIDKFTLSSGDINDDMKFAANIRIAGVSMENQTYDKALKIMEKREKELVGKFEIKIPCNGKVYTYTQDDL